LKIAFIVYAFPVITETFILNQITGLIDRGHQITIFCQRPYPDPIYHTDIDKYDLLKQTIYYGTSTEILPKNRFFRIIKALGIFIFHLNKRPLPLLRSLNIFKFGRHASSLGIFYLTVPFLENNLHEYDIAHCHFGPNGDMVTILKYLGAFSGKIVTTLHGEAGYTGQKKYWKGFDNLFENGNLFLPMSIKEKETLINMGCDPKKNNSA
jgi:colanic acid/amylovoran biosynthesis glycosyltransferase